MSSSTTKPTRYPFGWPAGSVRALLAMMVVALFCAFVLITNTSKGDPMVIPAYLVGLVGLVIVGFLAAQGRSINKRIEGKRETGPLWMWPWTIRIILLGSLIATFAYKIAQDWEGLSGQMKATLNEYANKPETILTAVGCLVVGYVVGHVMQMLVGVDPQNYRYQDLKAWLSMVAMFGLLIVALISLVINTYLEEREPLDLSIPGSILAGIIAFYYSVRS